MGKRKGRKNHYPETQREYDDNYLVIKPAIALGALPLSLAGHRIPQAPASQDIPTRQAIDYFMLVKEYKGLKPSSKKTYLKRLNQFEANFDVLPLEADTILGYLGRYSHMSTKYRLGHHDLLKEFYGVILRKCGIGHNPMAELERPDPSAYVRKPNPLNPAWLPGLLQAAETDTELAALYQQLGAGWRPEEFRCIQAVDVRKSINREHPIILCHGKERSELAPILPDALGLLVQLTPSTLADHEPVIRSRRIRSGVFQPMGETAHTEMIYGLYRRTGIPTGRRDGFIPYDLRATFASIVYKRSRSWSLTERLLRHTISGEGNAYVLYGLDELCQDLQKYSPLAGRPPRSPLIEESDFSVDVDRGVSNFGHGGDGGESNSPSRRSRPGHPTGLVSSLILPDLPQPTELSQASRFLLSPPISTSRRRHPDFSAPSPRPSERGGGGWQPIF